MQRIFIGFVAFCASLGAALGIFLYIALIPHFGVISLFAAGVVITGLCCVAILAVVYTYSQAGILLARRRHEKLQDRLIIAGEVVVFREMDGTWSHFSAQHVAAGIPRMLPAPKDEVIPNDDDMVVELYQKGLTYQTIMDTTGLKYNKVQRIVSDAKQKGLIA